jgi:hypothetical protein
MIWFLKNLPINYLLLFEKMSLKMRRPSFPRVVYSSSQAGLWYLSFFFDSTIPLAGFSRRTRAQTSNSEGLLKPKF